MFQRYIKRISFSKIYDYTISEAKIRKMKKKYVVLALLCFSLVSFAQRLSNESSDQYIDSVYAYEYAPGQHALNLAPISKQEELKGKFKGTSKSGYILLGGWGGYVVGGFDHSIMNRHNYDFGVYSQPGSGDEPGIVYVMKDENGNHKPDDTWYELKGNVVDSSGYISGYEVTYYKAGTKKNTGSKVRWKDNQGNIDSLNMAKWWDDSKDSVTFTGSKLPNNKTNTSGPFWYDINGLYTEGYAEVYSADDYNSSKKYNQFDISNAIDASGNLVNLDYIDFVKVQTGCFYEAGWLGEVSTEVSGAVDLNMEDFAATFEDITLAADTFINREANTIGLYETAIDTLYSGSFNFNLSTSNWGGFTSWYGVSVSNKTDAESLGDENNQYNSATGGDVDQTGNYGVVFDGNSGGMNMESEFDVRFNIDGQPEGKIVTGCYITNSTYGTNSMENGDGFAKAFGGDDGTDPDYFLLQAIGIDYEGNVTDTADFYLADFRSDDSALDYIQKDWRWFNLSVLGKVNTVKFIMSSTDAGEWGMNTPAYFCIDNIGKKRLDINTALTDLTVRVNDAPQDIDLSDLFKDLENSRADITKTLLFNENPNCVEATLVDDVLSLNFLASGTSRIIIKGTYKGMMINDTMNVTVEVATDLKQEIASNITIYPNPTFGLFQINTNATEDCHIQIYNLNGQLMYNNNNYTSSSNIDITRLNAGQYLMKMILGQEVNTQLLIKK